MKTTSRILLLWILLGLTTALSAIAGDAVIWGTSGYGRFLPSLGFELSSSAGLKQYRSLTVDPSAGAGVAAPIGSVGVRDNAGVGEAWFKAAAGNAAWTNILTGLTGWSLTGNAGTSALTNFIGTTDAVDFVVRTNNTERARVTQGATPALNLSSVEMSSTGNIGAFGANFDSLYIDHVFQGAVTGDVYGPFVGSNFQAAVSGGYSGFSAADIWEAGSSATTWTGFNAVPDIQAGSTPGNMVMYRANPQVAAGTLVGATFTGANLGGVLASDMTGYSGSGLTPSISGTVGAYNGFFDSSQWSATSTMSTNYKGVSIQPGIAAGATFTSGVGVFSGANVAAGVTITDWTGLQDSSDIDSALTTYNGVQVSPSGSGNATNVNLLGASPSLSGDNTNVTGIGISGTIGDDITTYLGGNIAPTATGTVTNVTGLSINNTALTSPNQKTGISVNDGMLAVSSNYDTSVLDAGLGGFANLNNVGGNFTVAAGAPVTGGGAMVANNMLAGATFDDDMPIDGFGGLLGYTSLGVLGPTSVLTGKTVHTINQVLATSSVPASSTGGVVNYANMYATHGFSSAGGTLDVDTELRGFFAGSNLCNMVSGDCFGVRIDASAAANYMAGHLGVGTVTASSIDTTPFSIQAGQNTTDPVQAGSVYGTNQTHFTADVSGFALGALFESKSLSDAGTTNTANLGVQFSGYRNSGAADDGTLTYLAGAFGGVNQIATGAAALTTEAAGVITQQNITSGNVTNAYDFYALPGVLTGSTITNRYGIYISPDDIGTKNNFISGRTVLGTYAAPTRTLEVNGNAIATGDIKTNTSLTLEDPGAGTNTTTVQAGTVSASYTVTLPAAQGAANTTLVNDGAGNLSWGAVNAVPTQFGTRQTGRSIVAGTGITSGASHMSTTAARQSVYVIGNGAAPADISASPQIEAGTVIGQEMEICGTDDTAYVLLEQDNNLAINGQAELTKDRCITLVWRGTDGTNAAWGEKGRNF